MTPSRVIARRTVAVAAALASTLFAAVSLFAQAPADSAANPFRQLHFRFVGPIGNRTSAIVGVPGDPAAVYVGAADGGRGGNASPESPDFQ